MELIHRHLCERDIFKHQSRVISNYQINSLENLASKQRIFRIFKEQHGFMQNRAIERLLCSKPWGQAKQSQHRTRVDFLAGFAALESWWSQPGSNRRPSGCKPDALPAELWPRIIGGSGRTCTSDLTLIRGAL